MLRTCPLLTHIPARYSKFLSLLIDYRIVNYQTNPVNNHDSQMKTAPTDFIEKLLNTVTINGKGLCSERNFNGEGFKKMADDVAHKHWWQIFEVVFGIPFLVAIVLQLVLPIRLPGGLLRSILIPVGVILIIAGVGLVVFARREFARYGQPTDPGLPTGKIISTGVFSISRNPLYLGGVFVLAGISLVFNLSWGLILLVPSLVACQTILIAPEERYLAARFGEPYREYMATVHRWIGRK